MNIWATIKNFYFPPAKDIPMTDISVINNAKLAAGEEYDPSVAVQNVVAKPSALNDLRLEFAKAEAFVSHGIETLGADAEADLVALVKRYR